MFDVVNLTTVLLQIAHLISLVFFLFSFFPQLAALFVDMLACKTEYSVAQHSKWLKDANAKSMQTILKVIFVVCDLLQEFPLSVVWFDVFICMRSCASAMEWRVPVQYLSNCVSYHNYDLHPFDEAGKSPGWKPQDR